jgi:hypothetical protein
MRQLSLAIIIASFGASAAASDALHRSIEAGDWATGLAICEQLAATEARRPDRRQLSARAYAEKAAHCAAIASGAGDQALATWWWFTAVALDTRSALGLLPDFREKQLLLDLPPPRAASANHKLENGQVQLPTGEVVVGQSSTVALRPEPPKHMFRPISAIAATDITVELLIDTAGRPTQPLLVSAKALPLHALLVFDYLRGWRFTPARIEGQPVTSVYRLTVKTSGPGPSRGAA